MKKVIVISAVNLSEGGPLTIIKSVLDYLEQSDYSKNYKIYALVHSKNLFPNINNIELLEFPDVKTGWLKRIKFEYKECLPLSKKLNSFLWFSLHDITPNVVSERRAVYCHNPSPFYKQNWKTFFSTPARFLYTEFYKELYRINIKKNNYVVVQQKWLKDEFIKLFNLDKNKIIISLPNQEQNEIIENSISEETQNNIFTFVYPAFPREFKNFEVICKAVQILNKTKNTNFEVILTINGSENEYAKQIVETYKDVQGINFVGLQPKDVIEEYYSTANCLIFPSKLETWGLPISEFKKYKKPMLVADLPYAYETVGDYEKVRYFDPTNENELANYMNDIVNNKLKFNNKGGIIYEEPTCRSWEELFKYLVQ